MTSAGIMTHEMKAAIKGNQTVNQKILNKGWDLVTEAGQGFKKDMTTIGGKIANSGLGQKMSSMADDVMKWLKEFLAKVVTKITESGAYKKIAGVLKEKFATITSKIGNLFKNSKFLSFRIAR